MQISKNKQDLLEIKTKSALILIDHKILVNNVSLEGAGEYEIGEITVEGLDDNIYICQGDDINFAMVNFKEKISKELIEKLSSVSLLFARVDENVDAAIEQVSQIEPNVAVYLGNKSSLGKLKASSVSLKETEILKLTKKDLEGAEDSYFFELDNAPSE
jgi:hypothetical protein